MKLGSAAQRGLGLSGLPFMVPNSRAGVDDRTCARPGLGSVPTWRE